VLQSIEQLLDEEELLETALSLAPKLIKIYDSLASGQTAAFVSITSFCDMALNMWYEKKRQLDQMLESKIAHEKKCKEAAQAVGRAG
jgi:hypothetical protein